MAQLACIGPINKRGGRVSVDRARPAATLLGNGTILRPLHRCHCVASLAAAFASLPPLLFPFLAADPDALSFLDASRRRARPTDSLYQPTPSAGGRQLDVEIFFFFLEFFLFLFSFGWTECDLILGWEFL